jgi:hypothetical protein
VCYALGVVTIINGTNERCNHIIHIVYYPSFWYEPFEICFQLIVFQKKKKMSHKILKCDQVSSAPNIVSHQISCLVFKNSKKNVTIELLILI